MRSGADRELAVLGPEPWGSRLRRARDAAGLELTEAVAAIAEDHLVVNRSTLGRLEHLLTVPTDPRRRALAYAAAVTYGFDPAQFGLAATDAPPSLRPGRSNH